ncbi:hypothetical protein AUEXF2481DRAFT_39793 [Aureobasidium subglaciale EXF-2481]|uniref:DUF92 domain-containing protein n=1 Tax=Aureobasidium subglaciale (strain EXF-2481) TaxID=1043005 RepID=A0A074YGS3_AURSE|nr:uncharacterized protein AUEXF2481DRAFT_39793 [Aureobasidium subglaciale EXF-2481]KAI5195856.1 hypothetical protein E4T38_08825 [Aureobasidium subglaciale]KAI5214756.1 hypothetical protein E4T40_08782 [Aureobasidium subglaciale]KAI5217723.1 hypothetical protein E4T41_08692 [Aureobasidium subglaciale]KAI5255340.1 hypothetical protein E4T46_08726 [Aureobasidium subglaciale]KEQ95254.1 hypothetical protein AUEXF2481DRAFT_39793 [Aureobasidium subglaciale EXF-2481]
MDFALQHKGQLGAVTALVLYSAAKNKLTPGGIVAAVVTAEIHMMHPWGVFFNLLVGFFIAGTVGTKINHTTKKTLTQSATGGVGGEGARNYAQVLANSGTASVLILWHLYASQKGTGLKDEYSLTDVIPFGIAASYAAAAADTLSSELGILSPSSPVLITAPWRKVPRGTNGGVTITGLLAGLAGSVFISTLAYFTLPFSRMAWTGDSKFLFWVTLTLAGFSGTLLDSLLGALVQATVEDKSSGRIVEGDNGKRVKVTAGGSRVQRGMDVLNNNGVNFAMAATVAAVGMGVWNSMVQKVILA